MLISRSVTRPTEKRTFLFRNGLIDSIKWDQNHVFSIIVLMPSHVVFMANKNGLALEFCRTISGLLTDESRCEPLPCCVITNRESYDSFPDSSMFWLFHLAI